MNMIKASLINMKYCINIVTNINISLRSERVVVEDPENSLDRSRKGSGMYKGDRLMNPRLL